MVPGLRVDLHRAAGLGPSLALGRAVTGLGGGAVLFAAAAGS